MADPAILEGQQAPSGAEMGVNKTPGLNGAEKPITPGGLLGVAAEEAGKTIPLEGIKTVADAAEPTFADAKGGDKLSALAQQLRVDGVDARGNRVTDAHVEAELGAVAPGMPAAGNAETNTSKLTDFQVNEGMRQNVVAPAGEPRAITETAVPANAVDQNGNPLNPEWVKSVADRVQSGDAKFLDSYDPVLRSAIQAELDSRQTPQTPTESKNLYGLTDAEAAKVAAARSEQGLPATSGPAQEEPSTTSEVDMGPTQLERDAARIRQENLTIGEQVAKREGAISMDSSGQAELDKQNAMTPQERDEYKQQQVAEAEAQAIAAAGGSGEPPIEGPPAPEGTPEDPDETPKPTQLELDAEKIRQDNEALGEQVARREGVVPLDTTAQAELDRQNAMTPAEREKYKQEQIANATAAERTRTQNEAIDKLNSGQELSSIERKRVEGKILDLETTENPTPEQIQELADLKTRIESKPNPELDRRNELSKAVLAGTATDSEKAEFSRLINGTFENGVLNTNPDFSFADEITNPSGPTIEEMSMQELATEQERLASKADRTPEDDARLAAIEAAWDAKNTGDGSPIGPEPELDPDAEFDSEQKRLDGANSTDPEKRARYEAYKERQVKKAEDEAREKIRLDRIEEIFKGMDDAQREKRVQEVFDKYYSGEELSVYEQAVFDTHEPGLSEETRESYLKKSDQLKEEAFNRKIREMTTSQRKDELDRLNGKMQRGETLTDEENKRFNALRNTEKLQNDDFKNRDLLIDKKNKDGLTAEEEQKLAEINERLKNVELTDDQMDAEINKVYVRIRESYKRGEFNENDPDVELFKRLKTEKALRENGIEASRAKIMAAEGLKIPERKKTAVERETQEMLQKMASLELQLLAIPRQVDALKGQIGKLKRQIAQKKNSISFLGKGEQESKKRLELYPLMQQLASTKGSLAYSKNLNLYLYAEFTKTMADLNDKLRLNGRLGFYKNWMQHAKAGVVSKYADMKTDFDSINNSDDEGLGIAA